MFIFIEGGRPRAQKLIEGWGNLRYYSEYGPPKRHSTCTDMNNIHIVLKLHGVRVMIGNKKSEKAP